MQAVDLYVLPHIPGVVADELVDDLVVGGCLETTLRGINGIANQDPHHQQVLARQLSTPQDPDVVLQPHLARQQLLLLPLNVLVEDLNYVLEVQGQHEDAVGVVAETEAVPHQQLVVVELAVVYSRPLSGFDVASGHDPDERGPAVRHVKHLELGVGVEGVVEFVDEGAAKRKGELPAFLMTALPLRQTLTNCSSSVLFRRSFFM